MSAHKRLDEINALVNEASAALSKELANDKDRGRALRAAQEALKDVRHAIGALERVLHVVTDRDGPEVSLGYEQAMESVEDIITESLKEKS